MRSSLACDTRLHLRFETFNLEAEAEVIGWIEAGLIDLFAFNDHTDDIAERLDDPAKAAARTPDAVCDAIGPILETFTAQECLNYFQNSGYART